MKLCQLHDLYFYATLYVQQPFRRFLHFSYSCQIWLVLVRSKIILRSCDCCVENLSFCQDTLEIYIFFYNICFVRSAQEWLRKFNLLRIQTSPTILFHTRGQRHRVLLAAPILNLVYLLHTSSNCNFSTCSKCNILSLSVCIGRCMDHWILFKIEKSLVNAIQGSSQWAESPKRSNLQPFTLSPF